MWFVYLLECSDGTIYCGATNNVQKRVATHNAGYGAAYTRGRLPVELIRSFECASKSEALKLEYKIKQLSREAKLKFKR